jgi:S-adenosylhomocysteine hydrolase
MIGLDEKDTLPSQTVKKGTLSDSDFQIKVKQLPKEIEEIVAKGKIPNDGIVIEDTRTYE